MQKAVMDFDAALFNVTKQYHQLMSGITLKAEQREIIQKIVSGEDCFVNLPTGFGKSMCYVLPPLIKDEVIILSKNIFLINKSETTMAIDMCIIYLFILMK